MSTLTEQLQSVGYHIVLEQRGWWHCLIDEDGASWSGEGTDAERAAHAAFQRMVPSRLARDCMLAFLAAPLGAHQGSESAVLEDAISAAPIAACDSPAMEPFPEPEAECTSPVVEPTVESIQTDSVSEEAASVSGALPDACNTVAPPPAQPDQIEIDVAFQIIDELEEEMHAAAEDVGELAPSFMRLMFLHWIARARACEEASDHQAGVKEAVHVIALRIASWAKRFWPGTVEALQYERLPEDSWLLLGKSAQLQPRTWTAVAECALKEIQLLGEEHRLDEDGWRDAQALQPRHHNPAAVLRDILARLRKLTGAPDALSTEKRRRLAADSLSGKELVDMAKRMRWIRGAVDDTAAWAEGMGLLRHIAWDADRDPLELNDVLSENWVPNQGTWAAACGQDPKKKARQRQKKDFHASRPQPGCTEKELQAWVARGLDVLTAPELLPHVEAFGERILGWNDAWLRVRGQRTRLRKVQQLLAGLQEGVVVEPLDAAAEESDEPQEVTLETVPEYAGDMQRQRVLPFTRGRRLLLVGNRNDQSLVVQLKSLLLAAEVELTLIDDRRIHTAAERIRNRSHDLVLCATGFISHTAEAVVRHACEQGGIHFVRVGKGRPSTVLRCLDRAFSGPKERLAVE